MGLPVNTELPDTPVRLLYDFQNLGWSSQPLERTLTLVEHDPAAALDLLLLALRTLSEGATFLHAAASYVGEGDLPFLAAAALRTLQAQPGHAVAEDILSHLSLQRPTVLHGFLDTLFDLHPNAGSYDEVYPWRESGDLHLSFLAARLEKGQEAARQLLLEARSPNTLRLALASPGDPGPTSPGDLYALQQVGFTLVGEAFVPLYPEPVWHLTFAPEDLMPGSGRPEDRRHPTWALPTEPGEHAFGGELSGGTCGVCGGPLHRLLTLDPVPPGLGVSPTRLTLATCLSCLGWEAPSLAYRHDAEGLPVSLDLKETRVQPQFPSPPLRAAQVRLASTPPRWRWQDWAMSNERENLHRLGGYPAWIQAAEYPECPDCGAPMPFVLQLDSYLSTEDGGEWLWGNGGIAYVFWCDSCRVSAAFWQCT